MLLLFLWGPAQVTRLTAVSLFTVVRVARQRQSGATMQQQKYRLVTCRPRTPSWRSYLAPLVLLLPLLRLQHLVWHRTPPHRHRLEPSFLRRHRCGWDLLQHHQLRRRRHSPYFFLRAPEEFRNENRLLKGHQQLRDVLDFEVSYTRCCAVVLLVVEGPGGLRDTKIRLVRPFVSIKQIDLIV